MSPVLRALLILTGAVLLSFAVFAAQAGSAHPLLIAFAAVYALDAIASVLLARAVLGFFIDLNRPVAFFRALLGLTEPFLALAAPLIPRSVEPWVLPLAAAFYLFFIRVLLFGGPPFMPAPPLWAVVFDAEALPNFAKAYLFIWARTVGAGGGGE